MRTASESGRNGSRPSRPPAAADEVTKGGPFDLSEMERLANEMFRALPGALLPGLDPDQLEPLPLPPEAEAMRPSAGVVPSSNGHVGNRSETDGAGTETGVYRLGLGEPARAAPASPPSRGGGGLLTLSGDPLSLSELGIAGIPRGALHAPFGDSSYFLQEATATARAAAPDAAPPAAPAVGPSRHPGFDVATVRDDFPALSQRVHGHPLVWLDNGATTHKPNAVIEALDRFYRHDNSNIHRGAHELARRATDAFESARDGVARFLHAPASEEIVFVRGATEAINLVAQSWGRANVGPGDEVVITWLEHHANIVPWQQLCQATGAHLRVVPVDDSGQVMLDEYERLLSPRTRIVAFSHISNVLGTITPAREMVETAHRHGAHVLIDGAQAVARMPVDVESLGCDWYAFSGHKVFAPTGIGVLYGKRELLNAMPPWQGGGNMIQDVTFERTVYQPAPARFEAGTASIADAVALGVALDYVERIGMENIERHEAELLRYATAALTAIPGLELIGVAQAKAALLSFVLDGLRPEEIGEALNRQGIAVRAGHHCAQPIVRRFGHEGTVRASFAFYNTCEDIDALAAALHEMSTRAL